MSFKDFRVVESIGKGSFASVYKVIRKSDNKVYALKRVKISKMSKKEISDALNEIRFLASIRQKNIVGFLQAFLENNDSELCIIMEYCGCGDLAQKVERYKRKRQYIDEQVIWKYLIQCLRALQHLHEKGICHRDLKVANTFLAEDGSIKIGDMNVSKRLKKGQLQTQIGTPYYMSPEIWNNRPYDARSDIWSLGCMIYELSALRPPFLGDSFPALKRAITLGRYSPIPRQYSDGLHVVIAQMLKLSARERPSADQLLKCPEVVAKLHLDDTAGHCAGMNAESDRAIMDLINTIKVPQNLNKLNSALPKPCYPDVRPNSPTSWTVADQRHVQRKPPPLPPVVPSIPPLSLGADNRENVAPIPSYREDLGAAAPSKPMPVPTAVVEDYYSRRPLAPVTNNRAAAAPHRGHTDQGNPPQKINIGGYNRPVVYQPSLDPIPSGAVQPAAPPANGGFQVPTAPPNRQRAAGNPTRLQYHHRMW